MNGIGETLEVRLMNGDKYYKVEYVYESGFLDNTNSYHSFSEGLDTIRYMFGNRIQYCFFGWHNQNRAINFLKKVWGLLTDDNPPNPHPELTFIERDKRLSL